MPRSSGTIDSVVAGLGLEGLQEQVQHAMRVGIVIGYMARLYYQQILVAHLAPLMTWEA